MRLKIPKGFNMDKWLEKLEAPARIFVWIFVMVLAILTVVPALSNLTETSRLTLLIYLILFFIAITIVSSIEIRHARRKQTKSYADTRVSTNIQHSGRNKWALVGVLALTVIILVPIIARQLLAGPQEYQAFLTAFAATGAWVTGIALAVFAYQQYKLRQTEHSLLFQPQIVLTSGDIFTTGSTTHDWERKPYQIKWTVFIQNTSQIPMLIHLMLVNVKLNEKDSKRETQLTPTYCHIAEPESLSTPFEVSLTKSQNITWVIDGSAGDAFDYVSGDSNKRDFILIFTVFAEKSQDPEAFVYKEITSSSIHVPQEANWISKTPFLDEYKIRKGKKSQ